MSTDETRPEGATPEPEVSAGGAPRNEAHSPEANRRLRRQTTRPEPGGPADARPVGPDAEYAGPASEPAVDPATDPMVDPAPVAPGQKPYPESGFFASIRRGLFPRSEQRWVGGVAGGVAERIGWDPLLVRGLLIVSFFLGGLGLILYGDRLGAAARARRPHPPAGGDPRQLRRRDARLGGRVPHGLRLGRPAGLVGRRRRLGVARLLLLAGRPGRAVLPDRPGRAAPAATTTPPAAEPGAVAGDARRADPGARAATPGRRRRARDGTAVLPPGPGAPRAGEPGTSAPFTPAPPVDYRRPDGLVYATGAGPRPTGRRRRSTGPARRGPRAAARLHRAPGPRTAAAPAAPPSASRSA